VEYPIGKVLYRHRFIADLRFSPDGKYLAMISHDNPYDDRGPIVILRSTGDPVATSSIFESAQGLAWNSASDEVWITSPLESGEVHAFSLSGKTRVPLAVPGRLQLMDRNTNGDLLVAQGMARRGIVASTQNGKVERDLSWLDFTYGRAISNDGKMILFDEESASAGYTVFVRNVDGSPAVPIGEGYSMAISPDKNWALGQKLTLPTNEVWLLPVGPGEGRRINPPNLSLMVESNFLSDGKRIVYVAQENGKRPRTWLYDLSSGSEHPITAEGTVGWMVSPDDTMLLGASDAEYPRLDDPILAPIAGGSTRKIAGLAAGDNVLGWSSDGQLYVEVTGRETSVAVTVEKLNPYTGARKPWRDLAKPTIGGVSPLQPRLAPDGASYFFDYRLNIADFYIVSGVR
jgi:WD40 repeat protein